jgi:tripartite ATP-independent transporter DctM subunit
MTGLTSGLLLFAGMIALMAVRVPIAIAMFVPGAIGYIAMGGEHAWFSHMKGAAFARFSVYELSVIPLFLLTGHFAIHGGLSRSLFTLASALVGHFRGGLAMAAILASAGFGAICGSSVATAATVTHVAFPEMRRHGYSGRLATATLAVGGTMGIQLPPSVVLIIYAIMTEQNIAKLFAAALLPALIAVLAYLATIAVLVRRNPEEGPAQPRRSAAELVATLRDVWPVAVIFVLVFGGIYGGVFTPTEGAGIGAALTFLAGFAKRELTPAGIRESFLGAATGSGMIFMIFLGADMLNAALSLSQMPAQLAAAVSSLNVPPVSIVAAILLMYILLGAVMDELSMILLTIPVLFPSLMALDLFGLPATEKAVWFGILVLGVVQIGLVAPPVGLNVYIVNGVARDVPMAETYRGVLPFLVSDVLRVTLLLFFPSVSLWLVRLMN